MPLTLIIQTTGNCWVDAIIDGEPVFAHLMGWQVSDCNTTCVKG